MALMHGGMGLFSAPLITLTCPHMPPNKLMGSQELNLDEIYLAPWWPSKEKLIFHFSSRLLWKSEEEIGKGELPGWLNFQIKRIKGIKRRKVLKIKNRVNEFSY